jgi:hypothetical protein
MSVTFQPLERLHIRTERRQHLHRCERLKSTYTAPVRVLQTVLTHNSEKSYPTQEYTAGHCGVVTTIDVRTNK